MVINALSSQESCAQLVDLLEDLPTLNMTLSPEEKAVIRWRGNVLLIGRSGTGKTTCAALRLWARNKLFSYLMENDKKETSGEEATTSIPSNPVSSNPTKWSFNSAFLSLSPVLCNQVKKYYEKLDTNTQGGDQVLKKHLSIDEQPTKEEELDIPDDVSESTSEAGADAGDDAEEDIGENTQAQYVNPLFQRNSKSTSFPLFTTLRGMLYMIDETLQESFFVREATTSKKNLGSAFSWSHDEHSQPVVIRKRYVENAPSDLKIKRASGVPVRVATDLLLGDSDDDDNDLLEDSDSDFSDSSDEEEDEEEVVGRRRKRNRQARIVEKIETSFEIGYNYFSKVMYSRMGYSNSVYHPSLVWTEIMSYIKGSVEALESPTGYLEEKDYLTMGKKRSPLPAGNRKEIYRIFQAYEREKDRVKGYDLQDMVFHVYYRLRHEGYRGTVIHSITVDEVQDFTQATLRVLFSVCNQPQGMFFTGDTCQTIARGVGFRFCELQAIFYQKKLSNQMLKIEVPTVQQLLVNYRSHSNLLRLSNSVLDILETHFPNAIDKLKKDRGTRDGPIPVLLTTSSLDDLFILLFGSQSASQSIEFGANQVIIVRDQDSKKKLPAVLQGAMVLTVYEAKGLEFEDVILFDFFADSPCTWPTFHNLSDVTDGTALPTGDVGVIETSLAEMNRSSIQSQSARSDSPLLCSELKHLYTAITRAKTRLFIFDRNIIKRQPIFDYWRRRGIVSELGVSEKMELNETIIKKTSKGEWKKQGLIMLRNRYFAQAMKCFLYSGDEPYQRKAEALQKAVDAADILQQSVAMTDQNYLSESERRSTKRQAELKAQAKELAAKASILFNEAGEIFLSLQLPKYAARCFSSAGDHLRAAQLFSTRRSSWIDAARCFYSAEKWDMAAQYYLKLHQVEEAIQCLEKGQLWNQLLETLANYKQHFEPEGFDTLIRKYVPIVVDNLAFNKSVTSSEKEHSVEESWQTMLHIISIVAPELGINLRNSSSGEGSGAVSSSSILSSSGYIDSTILSILEEHGFYELCLRLLVEHKKKIRDVELEFEHDFKIQDYVSILCFQEAKKRNKSILRRACNTLFEVSPSGSVSFLLRYGMWEDAAQLLSASENYIQAATVYQAFSSFPQARALYQIVIDSKSQGAALGLKFRVTNDIQEFWSSIRQAEAKGGFESEEQRDEAQELLQRSIEGAIQLKDDLLTRRLKRLSFLVFSDRMADATTLRKLALTHTDDLFLHLFLLYRLSTIKKKDQSQDPEEVTQSFQILASCKKIFDTIFGHLYGNASTRQRPTDLLSNLDELQLQKEQLNLFFGLQDPPPFSLPRSMVGGCHPYFIVQRNNFLLRNPLAGSFDADSKGHFKFVSFSEAYILALDFLVNLYGRLSSRFVNTILSARLRSTLDSGYKNVISPEKAESSLFEVMSQQLELEWTNFSMRNETMNAMRKELGLSWEESERKHGDFKKLCTLKLKARETARILLEMATWHFNIPHTLSNATKEALIGIVHSQFNSFSKWLASFNKSEQAVRLRKKNQNEVKNDPDYALLSFVHCGNWALSEFQVFQILKLCNRLEMFDEVIRRRPTKDLVSNSEVHYLLEEVELYTSGVGDIYQSTAVVLDYLDKTSDSILSPPDTILLLQKQLTVLLVFLDRDTKTSPSYLPTSWWNRHASPLFSSNTSLLSEWSNKKLSEDDIYEFILEIFDSALHFIEETTCDAEYFVSTTSQLYGNTLELELLILCLVVSLNFCDILDDKDNRAPSVFRSYLSNAGDDDQVDERLFDIIERSPLRTGHQGKSKESNDAMDDFFSWMEEIRFDPIVEVSSLLSDARESLLLPEKKFAPLPSKEAHWETVVLHEAKRVTSSIKLTSLFYKHRRFTSGPSFFHSKLASPYVLKACLKRGTTTPSPALISAATLVANEEADMVNLSLQFSNSLAKNPLLKVEHARRLELHLQEMTDKRKTLIAWLQNTAQNDHVSVKVSIASSSSSSSSKGKEADDEFELVEAKEEEVVGVASGFVQSRPVAEFRESVERGKALLVEVERDAQAIRDRELALLVRQQEAAPEERERKKQAKEMKKRRGMKKQMLLQEKKMRIKGRGAALFFGF